jgi:hypothetical protein
MGSPVREQTPNPRLAASSHLCFTLAVEMRALLAVLVLAAAAPASAADDPGTFGMAQRGSIKIVSGVLLNPSGGEMKGVWMDAKQACSTRRALRVSIQIDLV